MDLRFVEPIHIFYHAGAQPHCAEVFIFGSPAAAERTNATIQCSVLGAARFDIGQPGRAVPCCLTVDLLVEVQAPLQVGSDGSL
jgi:hypothetical protein